MPEFIHGLVLSRLFYKKVVKSVLESDFPELKHSAALIGPGSEVLGFDDRTSTDHDWGPRLFLFISEEDKKYRGKILDVLEAKLPDRFLGFLIRFNRPDSNIWTSLVGEGAEHRVTVHTIRSFFETYLGINPYKELTFLDWLILPEQKILSITEGNVFHDGLGELSRIRKKFSYYPKDVWLYLLASQWRKISEEEAFMARCGDIGDEVGSEIIAAGQVKKIMKLCFLMGKKYIPYSKWFGKSFSELKISKRLKPLFKKIMRARSWKEREKHLSRVYEIIARKHNSLKITRHMRTKVSKYYSRPYLVIHAAGFAEEIRKSIEDEKIRDMELIGSADQFVECSEILENPKLYKKLKRVLISNFFISFFFKRNTLA